MSKLGLNAEDGKLNIPDVSDSYSVIGRWTEPDGIEEWDVIHNGPLTYDEALKIAVTAGRTWDENVPSNMKNLPHREIPIRFEKLQKMIEKAEITEAISKIEDKYGNKS